MYRQGDVFISAVTEFPEKITEVPRENGRIVLAHGEVTGHAHVIVSRKAKMFRPDDIPATGATLFLRIEDGTVALTHEEHDKIDIPPGTYRVVRQREYARTQVRFVED